jgi:hypothetical protein
MKSRQLFWINAITLPDVFGPDARYLATPRPVEDCRAWRSELKASRSRSPVRYRRLNAPRHNCGREIVVRLESRDFGVRKTRLQGQIRALNCSINSSSSRITSL